MLNQLTDADLAQIVYQNPHPIFRIERSGNIIYTNPVAIIVLEIWGLDDKTSLPITLLEKIPQSKDLLQTYQTEVSVEKAIYRCIFTPVNDQPEHFLLYIQDISREKHADRMKTEFVSLASHQLRTPLTSLRWLSERLLKPSTGPLNEKQHEIASHVRTTALRLIELVNHLLNISRLETGRLAINPENINIRETINAVIQDLQPQFNKQNQSVKLQIDQSIPENILLDPLLIREVFMNLISNASKYSPPLSQIEVLLNPQQDMILCQIKDQGVGIPQAEHEKIFIRFYRASNIATQTIEGSGLGLYLVKQIVETSGGKIWFESQEGEGTSFFFTLPLQGTPAREGETTLTS